MSQLDIKLPKGTQDYIGEKSDKLNFLKETVRNIFEKFNGQYVETPVFELTDILTSKYGEEEKLIYNIEAKEKISNDKISNDKILNDKEEVKSDQNSLLNDKEKLSLRYDHTIPFVRYVIQNKVDKLRRYTIGKVYRREEFSRNQVRLREFYQADFDYVGIQDYLVPETEIFMMIQLLMKKIGIDNYVIFYNYRQNLEYLVKESNVVTDNISKICSSIDKLDKNDKNYVKKELIDKNLTEEQVTKLFELLDANTLDQNLKKENDDFLNRLDMFGFDKSKIQFNPSLARGLDYYSGIIFEVKLFETNKKNDKIIYSNSVAGGGRYDKLVGSYNYRVGNNDLPMIGLSFGLDRILPNIKLPTNNKKVKIFVSSISTENNDLMTDIKTTVIGKLINCEKNILIDYNYPGKTFKKEITYAVSNNFNYIIIVGEKEYKENKSVAIKNLQTQQQTIMNIDNILDCI